MIKRRGIWRRGMRMRSLNLKLNHTKFMNTHLDSNSSDPVEHDHGEDYQITIPLLGAPFLDLNHKTNHLNKNRRMITSPGETHIHFTKDTESRILLINIDKNFVDAVISAKFNRDKFETTFRSHGEGSSEKLLKAAEVLIRRGLFLSKEGLDTEELEWELVEIFLTLHEGSHSEKWRKEVVLNHHPIIRNVIEYIYDNHASNISLDDLTKVSNISKFYLIRSFKEVTGFTPAQFLINVRLEKSLQLLQTTKWDITTIGFHAGFGSLSTFERSFKKRYGISISEFQKKNGV
jgi:AraC-like DNA-binding protein